MSDSAITVAGSITVAIIAAAAAITAAALAYRQARLARKENRHERLEARLARSERDNRMLWLWCRQLVDHIYSREEPPPPPAPAGLFEETQPRNGVRP